VTPRLLFSVAFCLLFALARAGAGADSNSDSFAWGEEQRGIKIGLRVESEASDSFNLYRFTVVVTNCGTNTVTIPFGNTWDGPAYPVLVIGDGQRNEWRVSPPLVTQEGRGITHIPLPITIRVAPGEVRQIHRSSFVPPVSSGEWSVYAWLQSTLGARVEKPRDKMWSGPPLVSGKLSIALRKSQEEPQQAGGTLRR